MTDKKEYQIVALIKYEVYERGKDGQIQKPKKSGRKLLTFIEKSYDDCLVKLDEILHEPKQPKQPKQPKEPKDGRKPTKNK